MYSTPYTNSVYYSTPKTRTLVTLKGNEQENGVCSIGVGLVGCCVTCQPVISDEYGRRDPCKAGIGAFSPRRRVELYVQGPRVLAFGGKRQDGTGMGRLDRGTTSVFRSG